jgi:capsular polysaccharide transport system permease protein
MINYQAWFNRQNLYTRTFLISVILPTIVAAVYYGLIVSGVYVSEARFAVRTNTPTVPTSLLDSLMTGAESAREDAVIVRDYIMSHEMLAELDQQLDIRSHYSADYIDMFSRFDADESNEEFLSYYRGKIAISMDTSTDITTLRVKAFDAEIARDIAKAIIETSEALVNRLSERIVADTLRFARSEVAAAEARVRAANNALTSFRSEQRSINPGEETSAVLGIVTGLEGQLAAARAELIQAENFMQGDSPQVQNLRNKALALEQQIKQERKRLTTDEDSVIDYTQLIDTYEPLVLETELAKRQYTSALGSLELARAEAQMKQRYLLLFVNPKIPDEAIEPDRLRSIFIIFIGLCILHAIGGLIWAAIKDHMRL